MFKEGDRVVWNGGAGTFLRYRTSAKTGKVLGVLKWDEDEANDIEQEDEAEFIKPAILYTLDDVSEVVTDPKHRGFGYVITEDGTIYSLRRQYFHGVVCALLFPDIAKAAGYAPPLRNATDVYHFQRFELHHHDTLPVIRVAFGMMTPVNVSKSHKAATPAQIESLRKVLIGAGLTLQSEVATDLRDMTVRACLKAMTKEESHDED